MYKKNRKHSESREKKRREMIVEKKHKYIYI